MLLIESVLDIWKNEKDDFDNFFHFCEYYGYEDLKSVASYFEKHV